MARQNFLELTLANITSSLESTLFAEEIARRPGFLQSLDPRVKIVTFLALLLAVNLSKSLPVIVGLYLFTLVLAWTSLVPVDFFVKRVWLLLPFFTGLVAFPAVLNIFTPGDTVVVLWSSPLIAITQQGLRTAAFLLLRVGTSVSLAALLILCTSWATLLKALGVLRMPQVFALILGMTYRYLYLLLHTVNDMFLARKSRLVGHLSSADQRRLLTAGMGALLDKSFHLSGEVYLAMLARGFRGQARVMDTFRWQVRDSAWSAAMAVVTALAIYLGR
jgi:cobalt ECF transporter T component CbiQ